MSVPRSSEHPGRAARAVGALAACAAVVAAVAGMGAQSGAPQERFAMRVVTQGLDAPWEITWGPDGRLWVTERRGRRVLRVDPADGTTAVALALPEAHQSVTQDGLLGLAVSPARSGNAAPDFVFVAFTYDDAAGPAFVRRMMVRRYTFDAPTGRLIAPADVLTGLPVHDDHIAGRLVFGSDGMLYLSVGDEGSNFGANRCRLNHALDLPTAAEIAAKNWTSYQGKILRFAPDGLIPRDNPVLGGARSHVFSVRPPQPARARVRPRGAAIRVGARAGRGRRSEPGQLRGSPRAAHNDISAVALPEVGMPHRKIRDVIASRKALTAPSQTTVADAARLMKKHAVGALLIVDEAHLIGIFTERDALFRVIALDKDPKTTRVASAMTKKPRTIDPDRPVGHALHMMYEGGFRHVPVIENGRPVGMVSARDALGPEFAQFQSELTDREHIGEIL